MQLSFDSTHSSRLVTRTRTRPIERVDRKCQAPTVLPTELAAIRPIKRATKNHGNTVHTTTIESNYAYVISKVANSIALPWLVRCGVATVTDFVWQHWMFSNSTRHALK
eukprot:Sro1813_g299292.2  (109) ;mRNA; f:15251-15577